MSSPIVTDRAESVPSSTPAVLTRHDLAQLVGRSLAAIDSDVAAQRLPRGFKVGRLRRWLRSEIFAWMAAGAPTQAEWEALKASQEATRGA